MAEESRSLEYTPTWIVTLVCFIIILVSVAAERGIHHLGKFLKHKDQDALFEALQKLKEELMLLGFISLLLTVFQSLIRHICIPTHLANYMLPCKIESVSPSGSGNNPEHYSHHTLKNGRRLLSESTGPEHCAAKGKVPLLSLEGLHQLHIFIFVLAVVHMIFCATTMVLGGVKIRRWKKWEKAAQNPTTTTHDQHHLFKKQRTGGRWRRTAVLSWIVSFFKQFHGSVTKSDYVALRSGFIQAHCPSLPHFDFHKYILRTLEHDFKRLVGISLSLWLFVVVFLLLNIEGWHTYFWLSFLPIVLLLLVGAKLENIITRLAEEVAEKKQEDHEAQSVKPSDEHFWFGKPRIVLYLIHFILFQNAFEIAFFFWILTTYGFHSCIMEKLGYIIPRLFIGLIIQVLCSYSTLPLYALVTQMGTMFKQGIFEEHIHNLLVIWAGGIRERGLQDPSNSNRSQIGRMIKESSENVHTTEESNAVDEGIAIATSIELSSPNQTQLSCP
ncbi:hypothetical protein F0562_029146 [Nyssa sinensis]|uniref:MLO-like protein n=1 Tax=Nyssa sinensis TaxID=561372 RepID=A0A5J5B223_9ASTE|nr:hypothetical protein F0562_029146 [Nyssa sinensis]